MKYLILFILCAFTAFKVSLQSAFGKKRVKNTADALFFNSLIFLFCGIVFSYEIVSCPWQVWIYATLGAVCAVIFQMTYLKALAIGNVSLTALIVNMSLVINVLVSYIFYNDSISKLRLIGIILTIATFFLCVNFKESKLKKSKSWLLFAFTAMLANAGGSVVLKALGESSFAEFNRTYTSASYVIAAILAYLMYRFKKRKGEDKTFKIGKEAIIYSMLIGVVLALFVIMYVHSLSVVEGTFLFPAYAGGSIVFSTVTGVVFFKDKFSRKQLISVLLGVVTVVLMNF